MRKIKILLILILLVSFCSINIKATSTQITNVTISNENGFVVETIITEDIDIARVNQKSGTKTVNYYNGNTLLWSVSVRGKFNFTGNSSSCISSNASGSSNHSDWKVSDLSAWSSGNTAYASGTGKKYYMGISTQTVKRTVSLKCSSTGILS